MGATRTKLSDDNPTSYTFFAFPIKSCAIINIGECNNTRKLPNNVFENNYFIQLFDWGKAADGKSNQQLVRKWNELRIILPRA